MDLVELGWVVFECADGSVYCGQVRCEEVSAVFQYGVGDT